MCKPVLLFVVVDTNTLYVSMCVKYGNTYAYFSHTIAMYKTLRRNDGYYVFRFDDNLYAVVGVCTPFVT